MHPVAIFKTGSAPHNLIMKPGGRLCGLGGRREENVSEARLRRAEWLGGFDPGELLHLFHTSKVEILISTSQDWHED